MTSASNKDEPKQGIALRSVFEHVACGLGIVASIATGLAPPGSAMQASTALLMGTAFGAAYVLKR